MNTINFTKPLKKYIHYGSDHFDKDRFIEIKNCSMPWNKPEYYSGLWASPIETDNGWINWCTDNHFNVERLNEHFKFTLKKDSNIIKIHNNKDLDDRILEGLVLHNYRHPTFMYDDLYFDFEQLVKDGYDAIEVYVNTNRIYMGLYGWDCDSILILNPDCIIEI